MSGQRALANLQQGTYGAQGEVTNWSYYDTLVFASGTLINRLFTIPLGQAGKTLDITNMTSAGMIPQGQRLTATHIKTFIMAPSALATAEVELLYTSIANTTCEVILENKSNMGVWTLQELLGAATLLPLTPTAAGDNIPIIQPRYHGIFPLSIPLVLAALTTFEVRVTHQVAPNAYLDGIKFKLSLFGVLERTS